MPRLKMFQTKTCNVCSSFAISCKFFSMCAQLLVTKQDQLLLLEESIFRRWTFNSILKSGAIVWIKAISPDVKYKVASNYSLFTIQ